MKAQMKFQKILSLLTLILAAVVFVYALCFFTGNINEMLNYKSSYVSERYFGADVFVDAGQKFVSTLEIVCIIFFVIIAISYIMGNNTRRNYYVTNYVASGLLIAITAFIAVYGVITLVILMNSFYNKVDWDGMQVVIDRYWGIQQMEKYKERPGKSPAMFIIGIVVFLVVLVNCLAWIYNLIWKIKLMKGEKALLEQGLNKEVA